MFEPELLKFQDGRSVDVNNWEERRQEILDILRKNIYGYSPESPISVRSVGEHSVDTKLASGHAKLERHTLRFSTPGGYFTFPLNLILPYKKKCPIFILINFRPDLYDMYFPLEEITDNGFGLAVFNYQDITTDENDLTTGLMGLYDRPADGTGWGKISAWAFAASRVVDYLITRPDVDKENIAVIGHSRLGKTALWCGAQDERIKLVISNDSGCAGAAYERVKHSGAETAKSITGMFPMWFCENYFRYADDFTKAPFDQHFLLAACAPRYVCIGSASLDYWADQYSEQLSCIGATPAWRLFNKNGYVGKELAANVGESFSDGEIGYHLRDGIHFLGRGDWLEYMSFFKRIMEEK